jgi:hypothetical protein
MFSMSSLSSMFSVFTIYMTVVVLRANQGAGVCVE